MATGGCFPSNKERTNYARLCRAIVDLCTEVLRKLLSSHVPLAQIVNTAHRCPRHALNAIEWTTINDAKTKGYTDFDISLLCTLLRNIPGIRSPAAGWGGQNFPAPRDVDVGDDIERIRIIRNQVYGHSTDTLINDVKYQEIMTELQGIMNRFDSRLGATWSLELTGIDTDNMDPESQTQYIEVIKDFEQSDRELKKEMETIKGDQINLKGKLAKVEGQSKIFEDGLHKQNARFAEYEIQQKEDQDNLKSRLGKTEEQTKILEDGLSKQASRMDELETKQKVDKKNVKGRLGKTEEQTKTLGDELSQQTTRVEELENKQREDHENLKDRLGKTEEQIKLLGDGLSQQTTKIKKLEIKQRGKPLQTLASVETHRKDKTFVSTKAVDKGFEVLMKQGMLIYTGIGGCGKTKNALEVMKSVQDSDSEYQLIEVNDISKWQEYVDPQVKSVVLLDDCLGRTNLDTSILREGDKYFRQISDNVNSGKIRVIMTIRKNCLNQSLMQTEHHKIFTDEHIIDLSTLFKLQRNEKWQIFKLHCQNNNISICGRFEEENYATSDNLDDETPIRINCGTVSDIIETDPPTGFPQSCYLFASFRKYTRQGIKFFRNPRQNLIDEIDRLRKPGSASEEKLQYCVLSYMLLKGGEINMDSLDEQILNAVIKSLKLSEDTTDVELCDAVQCIKDKYIVMAEINVSTDIYRFQHETILEAVALSFGKHNPRLLIQLCSEKFIKEFVRGKSYREKEGEIVLRLQTKYYVDLANRFSKSFEVNYPVLVDDQFISDTWSWLSYAVLDDEMFINSFMATLKKNQKFENFINSKFKEFKIVFKYACLYSNTRLLDKLYNEFLLKSFENVKQNDYVVKILDKCLLYTCGRSPFVDNVIWLLDHTNRQTQKESIVKSLTCARGRILTAMIKHKTVTFTHVMESIEEICKNTDSDTLHVILNRWPNMEQEHLLKLIRCICKHGYISAMQVILNHPPIQLTNVVEYLDDICRRKDCDIINIILSRWPNMEKKHLVKLLCYICKYGNNSSMQVILKYPNIQLIKVVECMDDIGRHGDCETIKILLERWPNMEQKHLVKLLCYICDYGGQNAAMHEILNYPTITLTNVVEYLYYICRRGDGETIKILLERWPDMEQEYLLNLLFYVCKYGENTAMQVILKFPNIQLISVVKNIYDIGRKGNYETIKILLERWPNMEHTLQQKLLCYICKYGNNSAMQVILKFPDIQLTNVVEYLYYIGRRGNGKTIEILLERWPNMKQQYLLKLLRCIYRFSYSEEMQVILKHPAIQLQNVFEYLVDICGRGDGETIKVLLERWPYMEHEHLLKLLCYICKYGQYKDMWVILKHPSIQLTNVVEYLDDIGRRGNGNTIQFLLQRWPNMEHEHLVKLLCCVCKYGFHSAMQVILRQPAIQLTNIVEYLGDICKDDKTIGVLLERWPNMEQKHLVKILFYLCKYGKNSALQVLLKHPYIHLSNVVQCLDDICRHGDGDTINTLLKRWPDMEQEHHVKLLCYICKYGNNSAMQIILQQASLQSSNVVECMDDICRHGKEKSIKIILKRWPDIEQEHLVKLCFYICKYGETSAMQVILKYSRIKLTNVVECLDDICRRGYGETINTILQRWPNSMDQKILVRILSYNYKCAHSHRSVMQAIFRHPAIQFTHVVEWLNDICRHGDGETIRIMLERWPNMEQEHLLKLLCCICKYGQYQAIQAILKHPPIQLTNILKHLGDIGRHGGVDTIQILLDRWPNIEQKHLAKLLCYMCKYVNISALQVILKHPNIYLSNVVKCLGYLCRDGELVKILLRRWPNMEEGHLVNLLCYICKSGSNLAMQVILRHHPIQLSNVVERLEDICRHGDRETIEILFDRWPNMEQENLIKLLCCVCNVGTNLALQVILRRTSVQFINIVEYLDNICQLGDGKTIQILLERWPNVEEEHLLNILCCVCKYGNDSSLNVILNNTTMQLTNICEHLDDVLQLGNVKAVQILLERWPNMQQEHLVKLLSYVCKNGENEGMQEMIKHPAIQLSNVVECLDGIGRHGISTTIMILLERWPNMEHEHLVKLFCYICNSGTNSAMQVMLKYPPIQFTNVNECMDDICRHGDDKTINILLDRWPDMEQEYLGKLIFHVSKYGNNSVIQIVLKHSTLQLTDIVECLNDICRYGDSESIKILLERWPNVDQVHLVKLLCYICKYRNNASMQVILKHPFIQLTNVLECLDNICRHGDGETIEMLLGRWPNMEQRHVIKLFHTICRIGDKRMIYYILKKRSEVITQDCITDAFTRACAGGQLEAINCLLNIQHSNINNPVLHRLQNDDDVTNLHFAAFYGRFSVLQHLLKTFTDLCVTQRTKSSVSVLQMAMLGYIYTEFLFFTDMCDYIGNSCPVLRKYFIEGTCGNSEDYIKMLHYLIESRNITMTDLDMKLDEYGNTFAHYCVIEEVESLIDLLSVKCSGSLCIPNNKGYKPIHVAAVLGRSDVFQLLYAIDREQDTSTSAESLENLALCGQKNLGNDVIAILDSVIGCSIPWYDYVRIHEETSYYLHALEWERNHDEIISIIKTNNS